MSVRWILVALILAAGLSVPLLCDWNRPAPKGSPVVAKHDEPFPGHMTKIAAVRASLRKQEFEQVEADLISLDADEKLLQRLRERHAARVQREYEIGDE